MKPMALGRKALARQLTSHVMTSSDLLPPPPLTSDGGVSGTVEKKNMAIYTVQTSL